jgi:hypothetical protein
MSPYDYGGHALVGDARAPLLERTASYCRDHYNGCRKSAKGNDVCRGREVERSMKEIIRQDVVDSSLFLSDLSGRIFEWAQTIRHNDDATMRLLHNQQCAAADECRHMAIKLRKLME